MLNETILLISGVSNIPKKEEWSGNVAGAASNWDPRNSGSAAATASSNSGGGVGGPMDIRPIDPRATGNVDMRMMDTREPIQGNLRGVTGRLNGSTDMWQHNPMQGMPGMNKLVGPNAGAASNSNNNNPQWPSSAVPKDIDMNVKQGGGWDSSPPAARRQISGGNFDDGTSLWGQNRVPNQDPMGRNNFGRNPVPSNNAPTGLPPNRLPNAIKPEGKIEIISY